MPKIKSGYAGADGKPAAPLPYHDPAGGSSGSIRTVDGLLKITFRRITHEEH
jgi:hypothetical protein|nr:MAG TPA: hypothetical protein [Caudoviricetes sp.]